MTTLENKIDICIAQIKALEDELKNARNVLSTVTVEEFVAMTGAPSHQCQKLYNFLHNIDRVETKFS